MSPSRDAAARVADRLSGLEALTRGGYEQQVRATLQDVWLAGGVPDPINVRWQIVRRDPPWAGNASDNVLPAKAERPPLARVISPRGIAVRLYITCLFVAHCSVRRGVEYRNDLPLSPSHSGELGWSEVVAVPTSQSPGQARRQASPRDKRVRQIKSALMALADDDVRLVGLPPGPRQGQRKFEGFRVNHEGSSSGMADDVPYKVPRKTEVTLPVPAAFFLNGWQHALTDSEILCYLALHDLRLRDRPGHDTNGVHLGGDARIRSYGLSYDAYETAKLLAAYGLVQMEVGPERRSDGTYEGYSAGSQPMPHRYQLLDEETERLGVEGVRAAFKR